MEFEKIFMNVQPKTKAVTGQAQLRPKVKDIKSLTQTLIAEYGPDNAQRIIREMKKNPNQWTKL